MNTTMKRVISLLLCFVLATSCLPVGALAAEGEPTVPSEALEAQVTEAAAAVETTEAAIETTEDPYGIELADEDEIVAYVESRASSTMKTAAIFFSDVHEESTGTSGSGTTAMKNVLATIGQNGVSYETIGLVGDTYTDIAGTMANMTSAAQGALGQTIPCYYAWGDHDEESDISEDSALLYSGDYYYIYHISDIHMRDKADDGNSATISESNVTEQITEFTNAVASMDKSKILFIMSHAPLHDRRDDNTWANNWYTAIKEVADTMDVVVFWAHNHTSEDAVDRAAYYVAKDGSETMTIYNGSTITPNFTYMNAGYIYAAGQNPSRKGVATTVEIYSDKMVFQDYNSSGEYTDSSYSHNVEVAREFASTTPAVTLESISVSGTTEYYVGDSFEAPTVTAVYSDNSEVDISSECTFTGYDMSAAGTQTVTVTWGEETATTYSITVTAVQLNSIAVTTQPTKVSYLTGETLDTTGMVITGTYNNGTTAELTGWYTSAVDMTTAGEKTVTVSYAVDGITYQTTFTITVEEALETLTLQKIEITTPPTKTEYLISEELVLDGMVVTATFLNESNETVTQEIAYKPFSTSTVYGGYELDNFSMYVEKAHDLTVTYTYGEVTHTATTTINVWNEDFTDEETSVKVHVSGDYGVTDISVDESTNTNVATAIADVIKSGTYEAYDISLTFDEGYTETTTTKTVTLPIPEGVTNPVVYYVPTSGAAEAMTVTKGDGVVTFTTTHFSTYVIGESTVITVPEDVTASGSTTTGGTEKKTVYMLTTSISTGNEYLIADTNVAGDANLLANSSGSVSNTTATVVSDSNGTYIVLADATDELWTYDTVTSTSGMGQQQQTNTYYTFQNGNYYLYYESSGDGMDRTYSLDLTTSTPRKSWSYSTSNNRLSITPGQSTAYYLNGGSSWSMSTSTDSVYFYVATEIEVDTTTTVSGTYKITGKDISAVVATDGSTTANLTSTLTLMVEDNEDVDDVVTDVSTTATYEIVTVDANGNNVDGDPNDIITKIENGVVYFSGNIGTALVKVSYDTNGDTDGGIVTDYITVTATAPYYTIQLHKAELTEVADDATFDSTVTYYTFNATTGNYHVASITAFEDGVTYYTTPVIQGAEITSTIALKGIETGDTYSVWAVVKKVTSDGATDLGALGDALTWSVSDTAIATIDTTTGVITFTGTKFGTFTVTVSYKGDDGKTITDTITISATESLYVVPGDGTDDFPEYPSQGAVRFDKTASAVGNFSETGIAKVELSMTGVPYSTGKTLDVLLMLDMSTSMDTEVATGVDRVDVTITAAKAFAKTILVNDDGSFTGNYIAIKYFNGSSVYTTTSWMTVTTEAQLEALYDLIEALYTPTSSGTYYSVAMKDCYETITARDAVSDNTQALVFMSDGGPTYYTYVDSTATSGYSTVSNSPATIVGWFDVDNNNTSDDETDDTATPNSNFKAEYYSTQLKAAGYPIYTVGLGLSNNDTGPSAFTGLTSGAHEAITSYILSSMATNSSYFYNIADSDAVSSIGNVFSAIAASIKEAATDVVVEDKIGSNYTVNFSLPTGITSDATDGIEDFYIQVVDYVLDSTTHERTGVYSVLENFTFDGETGALISHTIDGAACATCLDDDSTTSDCVTFTNGVVAKIEGTYFTYEVKSDGEYLTWEADKISSTELALQYFAYLDNSAGTDVKDQIPAGTYYTNEYATLTYTNVNSKVVRQEFPIPQMTWNGAQVSYVFYLVNAAGQPVNRAGRVIPFAEAVYVTDVYTHSVKWNDMEQSAGLEAEYLANDKLPDAYELYDDDASYSIHVYENETEVNLNNHFVIGGDVTDDYNTVTNSWTNAKTTYVFNNKSDTTKYTAVGAYTADNGDDTLNETGQSYFCKSAAIEGATYTTSVENEVTVYTVTSVGNGYQTVTGETQTTVANITAAGGSTTGGTIIGDYIYYVDENGAVYTIVTKTDGTEVEKGFDFANTTVAFAVVWKPQLEKDTVVVDYGLDVVIDVITNDNMAAGVVGVRTDTPSNVTMNSGNYVAAKATSVDVYIDTNNDADGLKENRIGTATVENLKYVRFSLDKTNGMQFTDPAVFYYEADVNYYDADNELVTTSMYSQVTVIPATTVYYEDEYVTLKTYTKQDDGTYTASEGWTDNSTAATAVQQVDRPGINLISSGYDANNPYGYDGAYSQCSTYSMDHAAMTTVNGNSYATAEFTFAGTGFDIISMTSSDTGFIVVQVFDTDNMNEAVKTLTVDTYYGYTYAECYVTYTFDGYSWYLTDTATSYSGTLVEELPKATEATEGQTAVMKEYRWVPTPDASDDTVGKIYQVPVIAVSNLTYDTYKVVVRAAYTYFFDHKDANAASGSYDFYLDAIRIYDPTGVASGAQENSTVSDAYKADGEGWPTYQELRNMLLGAGDLYAADGNKITTGAIFIDHESDTYAVSDYQSYGPNNEVYLTKDQAVAFKLILPDNVVGIQVGLKSADGNPVRVKLRKHAADGSVSESTAIIEEASSSATDRYYSIEDYVTSGDTLSFQNTTESTSSILSITNIKFTYSSNPNGTSAASYFVADSAAYNMVLANLNVEPEVEEEPVVLPDAELEVSVNGKNIKVGNKITVKVTTSGAVESLSVNGEEITEYKQNKKTGKRTWTVKVKAEEAGDMDIAVTAYSAEGCELDTVTETITVAQKNGGKGNKVVEQLLEKLFG